MELLGIDMTDSKVGSLVVLSDGNKTFVGGFGNMFDNFIATRQAQGYPGEGEESVATLSEDNFESALMKVLKFDETFRKMPYDASTCKCIAFT